MGPLPEHVARYVSDVSTTVTEVCGPSLVGVYTTGSLALGDFRPDRSDVDLMAVLDAPVDLPLRRELARRLDHRSLPCPAAGLEFVLYPAAIVTTSTLGAGYLLNLNTGRALPPLVSFDPEDVPAFWYAIDRAVTVQSGAALVGPAPMELFAPFPYELLLPAVVASVEGHSRLEDGHLLDNAVLNGCRALRFGLDRRWYAKLDAAERTLPAAAEFEPIVRAAMDSFRAGRKASYDLTGPAVTAFLAHVLGDLQALLP